LKSVLSLIIILFLISSSIPFGFADVPIIDPTSSEITPIVSSTPKEFRNISVSLQESVGLSTNSPLEKNSAVYPIIMSTSDSLGKLIYLSESLHITSSMFEQTVELNSYTIQPQATLDRVSQIDKIKDRKKNLKSVISDLDDTYKQDSSDDFNLIESPISQTTFLVDLPQIISNSVIDYNFENILQSINGFDDPLLDTFFNSFVLDFNSFVVFDVNFVVVIFAPLVFFLFIFAEDVKFKIEKIRPILSLVFVVILLSTTVITPYSISSSYWPEAYADTSALDDNQTASTDNTSSSSTPAEDTVTVEATTSNQTSINDSVTNSTTTSITPINDSFTNSTTTNSTSIDIIPVNGTIPGTNSTGTIPIILPNATESWQFDTQVNGSRFIGDVYIKETDSSLILDGDGYVSNDGNSTSNLSNISVTAWVNPDYSGGSAEFTVVSKEKSFALTINNNIEPQHIAKFAVFDGIKWHTVETVRKIGDDWSHLAATFNGTTLSIYTNGTLSNVNESLETISLTLDGQLELKTIETITSTSDVIIGASLENQRSFDDVTKQFNGEIKEINIFNVYLTAEQVTEIYSQTLPMIQSLYNNTTTQIIEEEKEIIIIDVFAPKIITNSTNVNATSTDLTNATNTMITFNDTQSYIPITEESLNEELNKLTISTWINLDYTKGSAEFTVVSKENSFVLGINNIYSPEKIATFAIFDGITWTEIIGETQITDWSHLVAVINGTEMLLYLNGNLESQTTIPKSFVILEGEVSPVSAEIAGNDSDLIIGAYLNTNRNDATLSNHFSGTIDDVLIYKDALSKNQINEIYSGYVTPSEEYTIPFASQLLSFTDHVTVSINDVIVSDTIHVAPIDTSSNTPSIVQSISFTDYLTYKINGAANESSVEVIVFSDVVVATIIHSIDDNKLESLSEILSFSDVITTTSNDIDVVTLSEILSLGDMITTTSNETSSVTHSETLSESLPLSDVIVMTLNDINLVTLSEILSFDSTLSLGNYTIQTGDTTSNIQLEHDTIEINKPVIWTHDIILSNNTESIAVEIPADAEILMVKTFNGTSETMLFNSTEYVPNNFNYTGLYDDQDISDKDLKKYFRLIDSIQTIEIKINNTSEKIAYYANIDTVKAHEKLDKLSDKLEKLEGKLENKLEKLPDTVPLVSLQQVSEMLHEDKPLKVLLLNNTNENIELTFATPAPYTIEQDNSTNSKFAKKVTVTHESALHYYNVTAFSDIPENLVIGETDFRLFWNIKTSVPVNSTVSVNGTISDTNSTSVTRVDVTDDPRFAVEFVDTDGNGIVDRMQWIVPQLSDQEFDIEADLEIINVQSYPAVGGNWKVRFTTNGTADLIITAVNGTTFGTEAPDDLMFLELNNGTHTLNPIFNGTTITYYNYSSTEEGFEESQVLTPFAHHLKFQFGNKTAFAHNSAFVPNGPKVILLHGTPDVKGLPDIEDDLVLTASPLTPVIPNWKDPADRQDSIYVHSTAAADCDDEEDLCSEIQVTEAGTYRVIYGLTAERNIVTQTRYSAISYVQNNTDGSVDNWNANAGVSCFDYSYGRPSADHKQVQGWTSECLVKLEANGKVRVGLSKISGDGGSTPFAFEANENWFQMQKIENPTISLRKTSGTLSIDNNDSDMLFLESDIVTHDTSLFTFSGGDGGSAEVTVAARGLYKVSYSSVYALIGGDRAGVIGKIQTNTTGSFVDDVYGRSIVYVKGTSQGETQTQTAVSSSTILELNPRDAIKFVSIDETGDTYTATNYHLDVEYIGTTSSANVLRIYDSAGGLNLDVGTYSDTGGENEVLIPWDTSDEIGSHFTFTGDITPTDEITVNISGVYHISYGIDSEEDGGTTQRFAQKARIEIDDGTGGGFTTAKACFGDGFARGSSSLLIATAASSCMIELELGDKIRVVNAHESDPNTQADQITTANQTYLTIQSLTISNPALEESLSLGDAVEAVVIYVKLESLSLVDTVEAIKDARVSLTETLSLVDEPILVQSAGQTLVSFDEDLLLDDGTITNLVLPINAPESLIFVDVLDHDLSGNIALTESLLLDDGQIEAISFILADPDFKTQHGTFIFSGATGTITEGAEFEGCTGNCFIMQVSTRQTGTSF